jgi:putative FmdB family regulatory protein
MPVYEYHCQRCRRSFEVMESISEHDLHEQQDRPACAQCRSADLVEQHLSPVHAQTTRKG